VPPGAANTQMIVRADEDRAAPQRRLA